ncbi:MAG: hypothetical protein NC187_04680 [Candidatus Amulumruptor caecigallinarius]|nr:hypothetical protein [Candidatus Amulumruptor caecigallinarius]MCM1396767.1 hypothetical protein [Candidatus Amulumruptor caecigallinarius]MCM1454538.1 hypothetical protein [bacterium]
MSETSTNKPVAPEPQPVGPEALAPKRRKPMWWRIVKWVLGIGIALVLLVVAVVGVAVWILTPPKLTPLVEKVASDYLNADVHVRRVELTYWSTFPSLELRVDSLDIISHSLQAIPDSARATLPAYADSLLSLRRLDGKVNILKLLAMKVELRDVVVDSPVANIVMLNDSVTNFDILPPSDDTEKSDTTAMPDISINRFSLLGGLHARYRNVADSTDITLTLAPTEFTADKAPEYSLTTGGNARLAIAGVPLPSDIAFRFDTRLDWEHDRPYRIALRDCSLGVGPVDTRFDTALDFADGLSVESLDFNLLPLSVAETLAWLPEEYTGELAALKTDMTLSANLRLTAPYRAGQSALPSFDATLTAPAAWVKFQQLNLSKAEIDASTHFDGADIHRSTLTVKRLTMIGEGVGFTLDGTASDLFRDPLVKGTFKGGLSFAHLPSALLAKLPYKLSGLLKADATFTLRPSYLDRLNFHRLKVEGEATLTRFTMESNAGEGSAWLRQATLRFGSQSSFEGRDGHRADSLLTASLTVDTLSYMMDSLSINGRALKIGVGVSNKAASVDTTRVVPLGLSVRAERLRYTDLTDSSSIVSVDPAVFGVIQRYKESARRPLLTAGVRSRYIRYRTPDMRISLLEPSVKLSLHPNARPRMSRRMSLLFDSINALHPELRADSIYALARAEMASQRRKAMAKRAGAHPTPGRGHAPGAGHSSADSVEVLDLRADRQTRSLLQWWDASGSVTAKHGRILTPYFPLRNTLRDVNLTFDMDSTVIRDTRFKAGRSDFRINGTISNYTAALTRRNASMNVRFDLSGDTIDINQLTDAAFLGAAYAEKVSQSARTITVGELESDDALQAKVEQTAADSTSGPLLVPLNLDATLAIHSKVALYDGLVMHGVNGEAMLHEGALSLRELSATTDAGSVSLNALYAAPTASEMKLGMGMVLRNFYIERFTKLFPTLDSIMPALNTLSGRINAEMAATTDIEPNMDLNLGSLSALLTIKGDSLVVIDPETYKSIAKWLLFKDKHHNMIDSISAQVAVENGQLEIYPFIFNFDRYKLGVMGHNDMAMNLNYHVSVLKSPIPFKFGINIKGTPDDMKIRLGGAKVKPNMVAERVNIVTDSRVNLIKEMDKAFTNGMRRARLRRLDALNAAGQNALPASDDATDTISSADSALFVREGLLPAPPPPPPPAK